MTRSSQMSFRAQRGTCFFFLSLLLVFAPSTPAQVATGTPPFGSFSGSPDVVNLGNLNVQNTVPVFSRAGRGTPFYYNLQYNSSVWYPVGTSGNQTWAPAQNFGLVAQTEVATGEFLAEHDPYDCYTYISLNHQWVHTGHRDSYFWNYYVDPWGVAHSLGGVSSQSAWGSCNGVNLPQWNSGTVTTTDGSGYTFFTTNYTTPNLIGRNGTTINAPVNSSAGVGSYIDRNGNEITADGSGNFTDTLGTVALAVSGSGTTTSPMKFTYTAPSGASVYYQLNYTNYTVATNFGISGIGEYKSSAAVPLVTSIVLPDGSQYTLNYEPTPSTPSQTACTPYSGTTCTTARLASITLPTGGTSYYTYYNNGGNFTACTTGNNGVFGDGSSSCLLRSTPDGNWTYIRSQGSGAASTTDLPPGSARGII